MTAGDLARVVARHLPTPLYRVVRRHRVRRAINAYRPRIIKRIYGHGVPLTLSIQDPLAEDWYDHDHQYASVEIEAARSYGLTPGARVFDIGAHQGVVALILADVVGPDGRVIAVEADRHNARVAEINAELNGARHLTVVHAACTASSGAVLFHETLNGRVVSGRIGARSTRSVTVDELADRYGTPNVVYLDIEGFEEQALRGSAHCLTAGATFVVEVHASGQLQAMGGSVRSIERLLVAHGYDLFFSPSDDSRAGHRLRPVGESPLPEGERFFLLASRQRTMPT